ncbi:MAG TPA: phenylalanine--tRNA ligase subunit alpha [Clostridiaceae bacterium]|jgi:phenylalanyl-tRNA synthetase, alpha subunit|nr:phenylalanine--tRNA ligase subunit alpha [Clostridia bacterium]MED9925022.1 phenylalanine--tRNA ligase subunit alpha [Clostridia bacterium]HJJ18927.1 phenylalanine--tRNA ligase subunit alpha [Clostridiaceae bacterium]
MKEQIEKIKENSKQEIMKCENIKELNEIKVKYLGKKGELTVVLRGMGTLSPEERPVIGSLVNQVRDELSCLVEDKEKQLKKEELLKRLETENIDVTEPSKKVELGSLHPITQIISEVEDIFLGMGYEIADGPEVEKAIYNFDKLNTPPDHPARDIQDTFYITNDIVLRSQTSPVQARVMENKKPPIKIICPGTVYRSDSVDATHSPVFHQIEGLVVDKNISMTDLKGTLEMFAKKCLGENTKIRFRPHHFPFTEPSAEADVSCFVCGGKGCRVCKQEGWIELLGCGMVHPNVLKNCGIDPEEYSGFAFGFGVERIAMAKFGIDDMRLLFENDVRFLKQF